MSSFFCCCTTCYTMPETSVAKSYMHSLYCKCMYPWFLFHLFLHINVYLELGTSGIVEKSSGSIECTCSASFSTHIYTPKQSLFCRKHMWDFGSIFVFWSFFFLCHILCFLNLLYLSYSFWISLSNKTYQSYDGLSSSKGPTLE